MSGDEMCLAIPGKVLRVEGRVAVVDFGGTRREVWIDLVEKVGEGDYVLVHAGYAIEVLDEASAKEMLGLWEEILGSEEGA